MKRYSKKRESIIECMKNTKTHPSADWVYGQLKSEYPDLSLGTVYRNINELQKEGIVCSVATVNNKERFDARTDPHTHVICSRCGKIVDVDGIDVPETILADAQSKTDFAISYSRLQLVGICADCLKKEE